MGLCLFIKPFRSLKGKLQIKGDFKRHTFASLVRSSFISGASVDRRSLYFLDDESSPRFATTTPHLKHDDGIKAYGTKVKGSVDNFLPELQHQDLIESASEEEEELETLSQKAVDDALSTVTEEYLEDFSHTFVAKLLQNMQSEVQKVNDIILHRKEPSTFEESCDESMGVNPNLSEKPQTDRQIQGETLPFRDNMHDHLFSPIDYTTLCVPKDYCIFGNKVDKMGKEDRERILSKRGAWPSDEAIDYQFEFVEMMRGIEAENERADGEVDGNIATLSRLRNCDARNSNESDDETSDDDDDESLTITFEVGQSEINRHPDPPSHSASNEIMSILPRGMQEEEERHAISPIPSPPEINQWNDKPHPPSPPVSLSPPHHQRCPPPPYHLIYHNGHPVPLHPMMMGVSQEAYQLNHQMLMMMRAAVGDKECEGVLQEQDDSRTGYPHQWQDRRYYQSPSTSQTPSQTRVPPYPSKPNFRRGQRFGDSFDGRRHNHHQKRENVTPNQQNRENFTSNHQNREHSSPNYQNRENFTSNQQTRPTNGRYQPRPRPPQVPYIPSHQSPNYDRAPPPQCRQGNRWDAPTRQSHPLRQEWGGSSHHFGSSYHQQHGHQQHHVDRNNINRRQR